MPPAATRSRSPRRSRRAAAATSRSPPRPRSSCASATRTRGCSSATSTEMLARPCGAPASARFHVYRAERHHRPAVDRRPRQRSLRGARPPIGAIVPRHLSPPRRATPASRPATSRDFCERWGDDHDFAVMLDADSVMTADARSCGWCASCRPTRARHPAEPGDRHAVDQRRSPASSSSACGSACAPTRSAARGGRAIAAPTGATTRSSASRRSWRIASCRRCRASGRSAGHVLSHDQVEAVLMRRAGYEVRVLPSRTARLRGESADADRVRPPRPALVPGQHAVLAPARPAAGCRPVSRYQLVFAILMFLGSPAWIGWCCSRPSRARCCFGEPGRRSGPTPARCCSPIVLAMWFAPKIATVVDVLRAARRAREFGGAGRFLAGVALEIVFSLVLAPIMAVAHTLVHRRPVVRPHHRLDRAGARRSQRAAARGGAARCGRRRCSARARRWFAAGRRRASHCCSLPFCGPLLLAVPFAMLTASPALGRRDGPRRHRPRCRRRSRRRPSCARCAARAVDLRPRGGESLEPHRRERPGRAGRAAASLRSLRIYYGATARAAGDGPPAPAASCGGRPRLRHRRPCRRPRRVVPPARRRVVAVEPQPALQPAAAAALRPRPRRGDRAGRGRRARGHARAEPQPRQSDRVDRVGRFRRGRRGRAGLGRPALDATRRPCR